MTGIREEEEEEEETRLACSHSVCWFFSHCNRRIRLHPSDQGESRPLNRP